MTELAVIFGLEGPKLTASEQAFFRDANPWGFILFSRNIETPTQTRRLTRELRECVGRDCMIFVDQEGGRVQRFRPPHWPNYPSYAALSAGYSVNPAARRRATFLHHRLIAHDLRDVGVNANCAPVLDIPVPGSDPIISDRAFGTDVDTVVDLGHAAIAGLMCGGVAPVIKHVPGHGRAKVDSHKALPRISADISQLSETDFAPFKALNTAPMAMTAHAVYEAVDSQTALTLSKQAINSIARTYIGFYGLLMSDDLDMKALTGSLIRRTERALAAGCDIALQCSGEMPSMVDVAKGASTLTGISKERADMAVLCAEHADPFSRNEAWREYVSLMPSLQASV